MFALYNLEKHHSINGNSRHVSTLVWAAPYALCKHKKIIAESTKNVGEYFKIVKN